MINAVVLIFSPVATWERIARAQRSLLAVLMFYLLPLLALTSAGEAYGLMRWGKGRGDAGRLHTFPLGEAIIIEAAQLLLSLLVVAVGAAMLKLLAETFRGRHPFTLTFTVVAYSLGPLFLLRLLDAFPFLSPWVGWGIGVLLSLKVLYHGVPRMLYLDPSHIFGLFVSNTMVLVCSTGLVRLFATAFLQGKFDRLESIVSALAARLPF
jgi:hypothetical protein